MKNNTNIVCRANIKILYHLPPETKQTPRIDDDEKHEKLRAAGFSAIRDVSGLSIFIFAKHKSKVFRVKSHTQF